MHTNHLAHPVIMLAAVATGFLLFRRNTKPTGLTTREMVCLALGSFCGAMIGSKLPFVLSDWHGFLTGAAWFDNGKTILSGLVGGYLGANAIEWAMGIKTDVCDRFAVPVAVAVGIGRLGCFFGGCCFGSPTSLPWGVDFGDGLLRHPTQLYEAAFHLTCAVVLWQFERRQMFRGQLIRIYFLAYFTYRFLTEFIRPEERLWLGLTGYQWSALALAVFFGFWTCSGIGTRLFRRRRAGANRAHLNNSPDGPLHATTTLCPTCRELVPGTVLMRGGQVFLQHACPTHGESEALINSERRHYYLRDEVPHPPLTKEKCGGGGPRNELPSAPLTEEECCCSGPRHKTCIALLEITEACNLHCPVCFAHNDRGRHHNVDRLLADLEAFLAARGPLDILHLSGGEPLLHPELLTIIDRCKQLPIDQVAINTNGLPLLDNEELAGQLSRRMPRLEINLQMDGLDTESHRILRGRDLLEKKQAILDKIVEHNLPTTLVCTLVRGVNENQLGSLLRLGLAAPQIRGMTIQPATWSGRFSLGHDPMNRVTTADAIRLLVEQSHGSLEPDDFEPLPCASPNCCIFTFLTRRKPRPLIRFIRYEDHLERLSDRINFNLTDAKQCCGPRVRHEDFFRIVVKPFMDSHTYDQQRIDECCIHVIRPGGRAMSFCEFNTRKRNRELDVCQCKEGCDVGSE